MAILKNSYHPYYQTPKLGAGIGLGIVAALDVKPSTAAFCGEILIKHSVGVSPLPSPRSDPVPVIATRTRIPHHDADEDEDEDDDENFTYVTARGPTNSVTRVHHHRPAGNGGFKNPKPFKYSKKPGDEYNNNNNNNKSGFLSSCDMCSKALEGKDIYMYRGEKAFCSEECRERQIAGDERKEKMCRLSKRRSSSEMVVSRSPCYYEAGQIFTTGIIATY